MYESASCSARNKKIKVLGLRAAAGQINCRSNRKRNYEKANIEYRTSNNVFYLFKKTERSDSTIRHSTFDIRHSNVESCVSG